MSSASRFRVLAAAIAAASTLLLCGCGAWGPWNPPAPQPSAAPATVTVTTGDITSVVTAPVTVVATPEYLVLTPSHGKIGYPKKPLPGTMVAAGELLFTVDGQEVYAPRAGVLADRLQPPGLVVDVGVPVIAIRDGGFGVRGDLPIEAGYRVTDTPHSARVQLEPGLGVAECMPVHPRDGVAAGTAQNPRLAVLCLLDHIDGLADGLPGTIGVSMGAVHDVLLLPVTAVSGRGGSGQVVLVDDSGEHAVPVELGISDGLVIEIRAGLSEGDTVAAWAPGLLPEIAP